MKTVNESMEKFTSAGGDFISALEKAVPEKDSKYEDVFMYKCKIQNLFADWEALLKKWEEDEQSPLVN